ncbi:MAG: XRE family transcriptional regulator [Myxococcaceae bacterium]|nr:MAG: XRE family transcriptional regulator [Myxococcaceae bacterium]
MASDRALPPKQNEELRRRLRDLIASKYDGTLTHAAKALGVSHATLSDVLNGKRGVGQKLMNGMANVTGQSIDVLLGRSVELDPAAVRGGDRLGQHPRYPTAEQELRARLARRGVTPDETIIGEMQTVGMSRARPNLTGDFLMRLYEAIQQDREDNADPA